MNLTTGLDNTAIGFQALYFNTTGGGNTATGVGALDINTTGDESRLLDYWEAGSDYAQGNSYA